VSLLRLYVLFFIDLERRKVFLAGVTEHPIGRWVTQQARNLAAVLEEEDRCYRPNSLTTTVVRSARIFEDRVDSATSLKTS
jgi:hypothetical protein